MLRHSLCLMHLCFGLLNIVRGVDGVKDYNRYDFPTDFIFGASTSAYQVEGAALEDGRKPSIYDTFAHRSRWKNPNPDIGCDEYHKYKEDVQLMVETGLDAYRFSISWSRLIPNGRGPVNPEGLRYYNNLINELIKYGIEPHVTLHHTDTPQILEDEYEGFLHLRIVEDYTSFVDVCFREFGDRVLHWTTFNEANIFIFGGYDVGITPPSRCSLPYGNCTAGNSTIEPYIAGHHLLLAHASAVNLYKKNYQAKQHGYIGMNFLTYHFTPVVDTVDNIMAAQRAYEFFIGWFMHPLAYGDYPKTMKKNAGTRIPSFSRKQSKLLKGSFDFIGINYYASMLVEGISMNNSSKPRDFYGDMELHWLSSNMSTPPQTEVGFPNQPWGLEGVLEYFKEVYGNPPIFIHENGQLANYSTSINDPLRVEYLHDHIGGLLNAVRNGSNTKGYFVWSIMDVYELLFGYNFTFGLYYVNYSDPKLTRHPKLSQKWYSGFLKGKNATIALEGNAVKDNLMDIKFSPLIRDDKNLRRQPKLHQHMSS